MGEQNTIKMMSVNGYPYKRVNGEWVRDEEARRAQLGREKIARAVKRVIEWHVGYCYSSCR